MPQLPPTPLSSFVEGLVFGFDLGTGSIGYAVRKGADFREVSVRICPEEIGDLGGRNSLRRQRRTLNRRSARRKWLARELEKLGLPRPIFDGGRDPVQLRLRALRGEAVTAEELHAALAHLWKRRGYLTNVPWGKGERSADANDDEEEGSSLARAARAELSASGLRHPCEYLAQLPAGTRRRQRVWPRELLVAEYRAIIAAQAARFPQLAEKADWLLHGEASLHKEVPVIYKASASREPGVLGVRWARFENRRPQLDLKTPFDAEKDRPQHVARKNCAVYRKAQWALALENFRVVEVQTGKTVTPDSESLGILRSLWERKLTKKSKLALQQDKLEKVTIKPELLEQWLAEVGGRYALLEGQTKLECSTGEGRARYSRPTLKLIAEGKSFNPPPLLLQKPSETIQQASDRFLAGIQSLVVRHRLTLFRELFRELVARHGVPQHVVIEATRELGMGRKRRAKFLHERNRNEKERQAVREELHKEGVSTSRQALQRYRLWKETSSCCAFCGQPIAQADFRAGLADIAHIYPRALIDCNESYNLTVAHASCNRVEMLNQIPRVAFADRWAEVEAHARRWFTRADQARKLELFLAASNEDAEKLIESKASLAHTAYIATMLRRLCLIELDWLAEDGRDPSNLADNKPSRGWQVTNGVLTSRLRGAWGLNELLHDKPREYSDEEWEALDEEARRASKEVWENYKTKNRGDHRHHAIDAMVISCTLPWLAHRTVGAKDPETGECGWIAMDPATRRTRAFNPVFPKEGALRRVALRWLPRMVVQHHVPSGTHRKALATTILSRRERGEGAEEVFVARKDLRRMTPESLREVFSDHLREYLRSAWTTWRAENPDWQKAWKEKTLPPAFIASLRDPAWKTPIAAVKVVVEKSRSSVFKLGAHPGGGKRADYFVSYEENKEVRLYQRRDGKGFCAVFVRPLYPKSEGPVKPPEAGRFAFSLRRGTLFELSADVKIARSEFKAGIYRVHNLPGEADPRIRFFPHWQHHMPRNAEGPTVLRCNIEDLAPHIRVLTRREPPHSPPGGPAPASPPAA